MRRGWGSEAERDSVRVAFPNGSWSLDFQTPFGASNARNVVSSSSGGGGGGGYCENHRATRCRRAVWQEVQQEVQEDVQLGNKMAAGDSAKREWEPGWGSLLWAESMSGLSEWKQSLYQASKSLNCWKGNTSPPSTQPPFLHTVLNFYSFSSFLPFDGLLCVQAVGKFPVMVRSSTTSNYPHPNTHTHTITTPTPPPHPPCCPSKPGRTAGRQRVPLPVPQHSPLSKNLNRARFRAGIWWSGLLKQGATHRHRQTSVNLWGPLRPNRHVKHPFMTSVPKILLILLRHKLGHTLASAGFQEGGSSRICGPAQFGLQYSNMKTSAVRKTKPRNIRKLSNTWEFWIQYKIWRLTATICWQCCKLHNGF